MSNERLVREVSLPCSAKAAFDWHARPGAFERLTPPWECVKLTASTGGIRDGARVELKSYLGPIPLTWIAEHFDYREGELFCDRQISGPFAFWEHRHRFESTGLDSCKLIDDITYRLPLKPFSNLARGGVRKKLMRMFDYRNAITKRDLGVNQGRRGRVVISGASGLIGKALVPFLQTQGWEVDRLVRCPPSASDEIEWSPKSRRVTWPLDYHCDAVIHLAGANVAGGRWTTARKRLIRESRIDGTQTLVSEIKRLRRPPAVFISGSATGFYGDTGESSADETTLRGEGFLADVCAEWEEALAPLREKDSTRVVIARTGVVLTPVGGALAKMLPAFKLGLGARLGSGNQWLSWIGIDDWLHGVHRLLIDEQITGPVNLSSPEPVTQLQFARCLARVLGRPAIFPAPEILLKLALGEMAKETLLASSRIAPGVLTRNSYDFLHPSLEKALGHVLGKEVLA